MSRDGDHGTALAALHALLQSGGLSANARDVAEGLLKAMTSKTRLLIAGPESAGRDALANAICARPISEAELFVADTPAAFDPNNADICIWCTATFSSSELQVWQKVPDRLKSLSFLVPTADTATFSERLNDAQMSYFQSIADSEFYGLFPIVLGAPPGTQNAELSSTLLREIAGMVSSQRAAAYVDAQSFLASQRDEAPDRGAAPNLTADTNQNANDQATQDAAQQALSVLAGYAKDLSPEMAGDDPEALTQILTICSAAAEALAEAMQTHLAGAGVSSEFALLSEDARTAADNILLLSVEGGLSQTICAVTTLLQLRRELEMLDAA